MRAILSHVGAWAPKAEQVATAQFLKNASAVDKYLSSFKKEVHERLVKFYEGFSQLKKDGFRVDCIAPQAAIYLTVKFDLKGMTTSDGKTLSSQSEVTNHILNEAKLALVPFNAFGSSNDSTWYRLSVGTCNKDEIPEVFNSLKSIPPQASMMDVMRTGASLLAHWDPETADNSHDANVRKAERLTAQLPVVLAARQRFLAGKEPVAPDAETVTVEPAKLQKLLGKVTDCTGRTAIRPTRVPDVVTIWPTSTVARDGTPRMQIGATVPATPTCA